MQIKLPLYALDHYQTHDLLLSENIDNRIVVWLKGIKSFPIALNSGGSGILLIERFTPSNFPWCYNYSEKLFYFYRLISKTGRYNEPSFNGNHLFTITNYGNQLQGVDSPSYTFPDVTTIENTNDTEIIVTWLEDSFQGEILSINKNEVYNWESYPYGKIYIKRFKRIPAKTSVNISTKYMLLCSMVVSGKSSQAVENQLSDYYLFSQFDNIFNYLIAQIILEFPMIGLYLSKIFFEIKTKTEIRSNAPRNNDLSLPASTLTISYGGEAFDYGQAPTGVIPEWYHYTSLIFADNDYWKNGEVYSQDLGKEIKLEVGSNSLNFHVWGKKEFPIHYLTPAHDEATELRPYGYSPFDYNFTHGEDTYSVYYEGDYEINNHVGIHNTFQSYPLDSVYNRAFYTNQTLLGTTDPFLIRIEGNYPVIFIAPYIRHDYEVLETIPVENSFDRYRFLVTSSYGYFRSVYRVDLNREFYQQEYTLIDRTLGFVGSATVEPPISGTVGGGAYPFSTDIEYTHLGHIDFTPWTLPLAAPEFHPEIEVRIFIDTVFSKISTNGESENTNMPDSIRIKEIHAALQADKFARDDKTATADRVANLGYYIERLCRIFGISVNSDGSERSIRQAKHVKQGKPIPAGWLLGQWGRNQGGVSKEGQTGGLLTEDRDGIVYDVISNRFTRDPRTGKPTKIEAGGYILCENFPQYLAQMLDDLDKAIGWQEAGANAIPSLDGKAVTYEGINTVLCEQLYMMSRLSKGITGGHIVGMKNQAMIVELLAHQGAQGVIKELEVDVGDEKAAKIPYPAISPLAPTIYDQTVWLLSNLAPLVAATIGLRRDVKDEEDEAEEKQKPEDLFK